MNWNGLALSRLRIRIVIIVLLAIIPALGLMVYSSIERRTQDARLVQENALRLSRIMANNLDRDIHAAHGFLLTLTRIPSIRSGNYERCNNFLSAFLEQSKAYSNLGIATPDGSVFCSGLPEARSTSLGNADWFREVTEGDDFAVGYDLDKSLSDGIAVTLGLPLRDNEGLLKGVLFAAIDMEWLNDLAARSQLPEGSAFTVTNRFGAALVRYPNPEKWVGKSYQDAPLVKAILTQGEGNAEAIGLDGIERFYAFSTTKSGHLMVRIGVTREAAFAAANQSMSRNLVGLGIVATFALLAAWFGGNWFLGRQVDALVDATHRLSAGDLGARTNLRYDKGELGQLAQAFDEMAESLEWRNAQLRESEAERWSAEALFSEVAEATGEAIVAIDNRLSILVFNRKAEKFFGYGAAEVIGQPFQTLLRGGGEDLLLKHLERLFDGGMQSVKKGSLEVLLRTSSGEVIPSELSYSPVTRDGKTTVTCIFRRAAVKRGSEGGMASTW